MKRSFLRGALKYLGRYVARSAISDARLAAVTSNSVSFRWKNRDRGNRIETRTLPGIEFVRRYLLHVLPKGLRSIRYYGFCHPAAKANRLRVQLHSGRSVQMGSVVLPTSSPGREPCCPCCGKPARLLFVLTASYKRKRGPPSPNVPASSPLCA